MRWLKFIYDQYIKDLKEEKIDLKMQVSQKDIEILREAKKESSKSLTIIFQKQETPKVCEVYIIGSLYFVISDTEEYPYEVFIVSPYWELASDEDLIADGRERRWVIENLVRYVDNRILGQSLRVDEIRKEDLELMQNFINGSIEQLPKEKTGLSYEKGKGYYQELFKENERRRSLFLMPNLGFEPDIEEEITIDLTNTIKDVTKQLNQRLAAASYDAFIVAEYGGITKEDKMFYIYFNDDYYGTLSRVYVADNLVYEGFLPKKLLIKSDIKHPQLLKEVLKIELL